MFPTAYEAPRIRVMLVDAHSGDKFEGWVVRTEGYVFGLEDWFKKYDVPAGGLVTVRTGDGVGEVVLETNGRRMRNDWIRTVTIDEEGLIGFTMLKQPVGTVYDDLMVIGLIDPQTLDEAWLQGSQRKHSFDRVVAHVADAEGLGLPWPVTAADREAALGQGGDQLGGDSEDGRGRGSVDVLAGAKGRDQDLVLDFSPQVVFPISEGTILQ